MTESLPDKRTTDWFQSIPRRFFRFPTWVYSVYWGMGYAVAGILHYVVWIENKTVQTIFTNLGITSERPTALAALTLFGVAAVVAGVVLHVLLRRLGRGCSASELVFWGTAVSVGAAWLPWLFASSIVTTLFLFLFGMTAVAGFALSRIVLLRRRDQGDLRHDHWRMFANATKACAAVVAVVLGAVATSALLPWRNTRVEGPELFRYALLAAWMIAGMLAFVLMPLFVKALETAPLEDVELEPPGPI